jgi:hypothetical protein
MVGQDFWLKGKQAVRWWAATDVGSMVALNAWGASGGFIYMLKFKQVWFAPGVRVDAGVFAQTQRLTLERLYDIDYPDHLLLVQPVVDVWMLF